MTKDELKGLFNQSTRTTEINNDREKQLNTWAGYVETLIKGDKNALETWVEEVPKFITANSTGFGGKIHALGGYKTFKIYKKGDKYYNSYKKDEEGKDDTQKGKSNEKEDLEATDNGMEDLETFKSEAVEDFKNIADMVKAIKDAKDLTVIDNNKLYKEKNKTNTFRKIAVMTLFLKNKNENENDKDKLKHSVVDIYDDEAINELLDILEIKDKREATYLEKNAAIVEAAKKALGKPDDEFNKYVENGVLGGFLWSLYFKRKEFTDFSFKNLIFNGPPGTGKTYEVTTAIAQLQAAFPDKYDYPYWEDEDGNEEISEEENKDGKKRVGAVFIQFHPSYTYQDFIEGIKPTGIEGGNLKLEVVNGKFKEFCIKVREANEYFYKHNPDARDDDGKPICDKWPHYYFVVDEINRGNLSNIFGETFTLLEDDYRDYDFSNTTKEGKVGYDSAPGHLVATSLSSVIKKVCGDDDEKKKQLIYKEIDGEPQFGIPFNIHFIGMMNDVDRSIDAFDLALRRRFKWIAKKCDYDVIKNEIEAICDTTEAENFKKSCEALNDFLCDTMGLGSDYAIGHAFFLKIRPLIKPNKKDEYKITEGNKTELFENFIEGTVKEYLRQIDEGSGLDQKINDARNAFGIKKKTNK